MKSLSIKALAWGQKQIILRRKNPLIGVNFEGFSEPPTGVFGRGHRAIFKI